MKKHIALLSLLAVILIGIFSAFTVKRRVNPMILYNFTSISEMRTYVGPHHNQRATTMGVTSIGDQYLRTYYYDTNSLVADDGVNYIKLAAHFKGRFIKIPDIINPTQVKKQETLSATTSSTAGAGLGLATFTFSNTYTSSPVVTPTFISNNPQDKFMLESVSTTGCTVRITRLTSLVGLLPTYTNQGGVTVKVVVTAE